ncbi:MAG: N-acetyl-gamma-glutamyl-phosphate reductase [Muribaculaceae bacterium]|nr:N-acetyl-gamma-glutamyl-phosphate reductase [Muribaculaceae bacterium]
MIKVGITGGHHPAAGELIRILINHPDIELQWVAAPELAGRMISGFHKGLLGETYMRFTDEASIDDIDVLFMCPGEQNENKSFLESIEIPENLKIIDLSSDFRISDSDSEWVYGLPELNRKPLVRGAKRSAIPGAYATIVALSLLPMAKNLMLNGDIHVAAVAPSGEFDDNRPGEAIALLDHEEVDEIKYALRQLQSSFNSDIKFVATAGGWKRGLTATVYLDTNVSEDELKNIYDEFYEDHNFTFLSDTVPSLADVIGTNKCIIHIQKAGNTLAITSVLDAKLKGEASNAVHNMNLLFGLQERVGLTLKAAGE